MPRYAMSLYQKNSNHVTTRLQPGFAMATPGTDLLLYLGLLRQEILLSPVICERSLTPMSTILFHTTYFSSPLSIWLRHVMINTTCAIHHVILPENKSFV
jgi:hypothetical protein